MEPIIIKGCLRDHWEEVQAIQNIPFIYIISNGSKWAGDEEDDIEKLYQMLEDYSLDVHNQGSLTSDFWTDNPCEGIRNWEDKEIYGVVPKWVDGDRLYGVEGVTRFTGNFLYYSHVFWIDTNHVPSIQKLKKLISKNLEKVSSSSLFVGDESQKDREAKLSSAAAILGKAGGQSRSSAKVSASRSNGKLGGRPKKPIVILD
jgi:hypothetical protein